MGEIDDILKLMSWNSSQEEQLLGKALARKVNCLKAFFQPISKEYSKDVWENCAIILCERTDGQLLPYLADMLLWLQDRNWPGADRILERLLRFQDTEPLAKTLCSFAIALDALGESVWLRALAELLQHRELAARLDAATRNLLQAYA